MTDESFEVLNIEAVRRNGTWLRELFGDISRQSVGKQIAIGGVSGWCAGYLFVKVGKVAAATLGTTVLVLQIAQHQGFIQINWNKLHRETERVRRQLEASRRYVNFAGHEQIRHFVKENIFLAGGFAAGFLLALAF